MDRENILEVKGLEVGFHTYRGVVRAVRGVSFEVKKGEALGIVGESGCGKSVTAQAVMGLLPKEVAEVSGGSAVFDGEELLSLEEAAKRRIRGNRLAMIFQDPMTSLNPVLSIGTQLTEGLCLHRGLDAEAARLRAVELLQLVGIPAPEQRLADYPHQFSGGMRQRAMIAMALACEPELLFADEPTTALDVTIQAQIIELLAELKARLGMSIVLISHDLGVIAGLCDRVQVMYAGQIIEGGTAEELFAEPLHPYTQGLLAALPRPDADKAQELTTIDGQPPDLLYAIRGCAFAPRCPYAMRVCVQAQPPETVAGTHRVSCWLQQKKEIEEGRL